MAEIRLEEDLQEWIGCENQHTSEGCPSNRILNLLGRKWTVSIIYFVEQRKVVRFLELQRLIKPITQKELTKRLRELEEVEVISRKVYAEIPPRVEYRLTERGAKLIPYLAGLALWAK